MPDPLPPPIPADPAAAAAPAPGSPGDRPVRFFHRGRIVEVADAPPTLSVLAWLRERAGLTGTKEGCNEGDCGACTVLVGELDGAALRLHTVNACIRLLPTLDGKALWTVEDLAPVGAAPAALHPAQQALVDYHGSQCGFCTPGFAMALAAVYQQHTAAGTRPTRQALADALSGNLCRCTGYRPILDAGQRMFELPAQPLDTAAALAALQQLRADAPLARAGFHAPRTLDALAAARLAQPQARLLAGGTDIALWINKQLRDVGDLVYLGEVGELKAIGVAGGELVIGAGAPLDAAWDALARHWPVLREMGLRFASPPIRHAGTLGGNIANGSPIGDGAPVLMALGARLRLRRGAAERFVALDEFYLGYMRNALQAGEFVAALHLPLPAPDEHFGAYKLAKRFDSDISAVAAGLWLRLDGGVVAAARLAFGGLAATVRRARAAEAALVGRPWTEAAVGAAMAALDAEFTPLDDLRASAAYRKRGARAFLQRLWLQTRAAQPLAPAELSVWEAR